MAIDMGSSELGLERAIGGAVMPRCVPHRRATRCSRASLRQLLRRRATIASKTWTQRWSSPWPSVDVVDSTAHDLALDLGGALEQLVHLGIAEHALDRGVLRDAVHAVDVEPHAYDIDRGLRHEQLRGGDLEDRVGAPLVLARRSPVQHLA